MNANGTLVDAIIEAEELVWQQVLLQLKTDQKHFSSQHCSVYCVNVCGNVTLAITWTYKLVSQLTFFLLM